VDPRVPATRHETRGRSLHPPAWRGFSIAFRYHSARYDIVVENPKGMTRGVSLVEIDGVPCGGRTGIQLVDDRGEHRIRIVLG